MKLVFDNIDKVFTLNENSIQTIILENTEAYRYTINEIIMYISGENSGLSIYDRNDEKISYKDIEFFSDIINIDINSKKIKNKLNLYLEEIAVNEDLYIKTNEIIGEIYNYFGELDYYSDINFEIQEINPKELIKISKVKINEENGFKEKIIEVIKIYGKFNLGKVIFFLNLKLFCNDQDLIDIYKCAEYEEIKLVLIEKQLNKNNISKENIFVLDTDLCELY